MTNRSQARSDKGRGKTRQDGGPVVDGKESGLRERPKDGSRWIDRYHLLHCVAVGGMGEVHLALRRADGEFRRWVALKLVHPDVAGSKRFVEMFRTEARLAARLDSPHICSVHDFGVVQGTPYLAMEYLHGLPLALLGQRAAVTGGVPPHIAARVVADAARGLAAAHAHCDDQGELQPVVHRDVSPHNLMVLYSGTTKVVDFGIARPVDDRREFTRTGEVRGKVAYMPPEQLRGDTPHPTMDIWALGVLLWEVTLGRRLFCQATDVETMTRVMVDPIPTPGSMQQTYPAALEAVVMRALQRDPKQRYASALDMARDLEAYVKECGYDGHDFITEYLAQHFESEKTTRETLLRDLARDVRDAPIDLVVRRSSLPGEDIEELSFDDVSRERPTLPTGRGEEDEKYPHIGALPTLRAPRIDVETTPVATFEAPRPSRRGMGLALLSLAGVAVVLVTGALLWNRTPAAPERRPTPTVAVVAPVVAAPAVVAPVVAAPTVVAPVVAAPAVVTPAARDHLREVRRAPVRAVASPTTNAAVAPATTMAATNATGRLSLRSAVPGSVFEGSRRIGHTPLVGVALSPGTHSLRVVPDEEGGTVQELEVEIESGAESTVSLRGDGH